MNRSKEINTPHNRAAVNNYDDHRLYELLNEREALLDERFYLAARIEGNDEQLRQAHQRTKPRRVDSLAEYNEYRRHLESLEELTEEGAGKIRGRLEEIDSRLRQIPQTLLDEGVIPEGLWVGYTEKTDVRVDRYGDGNAYISKATSDAVASAASGHVRDVRAKEMMLRYSPVRRFAHRALALSPSSLRSAGDFLMIGGTIGLWISTLFVTALIDNLAVSLATTFTLIGISSFCTVSVIKGRQMSALNGVVAGVAVWIAALATPWVMELIRAIAYGFGGGT